MGGASKKRFNYCFIKTKKQTVFNRKFAGRGKEINFIPPSEKSKEIIHKKMCRILSELTKSYFFVLF